MDQSLQGDDAVENGWMGAASALAKLHERSSTSLRQNTKSCGDTHLGNQLQVYSWSQFQGFPPCWRQVEFTKTPSHETQLMRCTARELTLEAAQSAGSSRSFSTRTSSRDLTSMQIKKLLDSRNDREILEGLRKVISVRPHLAGPRTRTAV